MVVEKTRSRTHTIVNGILKRVTDEKVEHLLNNSFSSQKSLIGENQSDFDMTIEKLAEEFRDKDMI